jgi:NAD(P)H-hydrate epimerase
MKILTAEQMRAVDARSVAAGIPGIVLMENAGCRVVELLEREFAPLRAQRIVVVCGKGNNGGDGLVIARQLSIRHRPAALHVVLAEDPQEFRGDAATNWSMFRALGLTASREIAPAMRAATLIVDALLGTGLNGPARGRALELIREMNAGFPAARIVSVDVPSGLHAAGESVRAERTVTFAAWKTELALPPTCDRASRVEVAPIGIPHEFIEADAGHWLNRIEPSMLAPLFVPRSPSAHKGSYGHVLVVGGATGKGGAAAMSGAAALRAGAGLVTVATEPQERATVTSFMPELMSTAWPGSASEDPSAETLVESSIDYRVDAPADSPVDARIDSAADSPIDSQVDSATDPCVEPPSDSNALRDVLAIGPGLGRSPRAIDLARTLFAHAAVPAVVDADALNALAGFQNWSGAGRIRILTPHPGEMARLTGLSTAQVQADRVGVARSLARERSCTVVLKGQRTVIAHADGRVYINSTGTPAMATAGSGDILTGLIVGLVAQHPGNWQRALLAAVWLHGRAGELGAGALGEQSLTATDLLRYLPAAMGELRE